MRLRSGDSMAYMRWATSLHAEIQPSAQPPQQILLLVCLRERGGMGLCIETLWHIPMHREVI